MDLFVLTPDVAEEVISHARAGFPDEVCGLIFGRHNLGWVLYRGRNVSTTPRWAYELDSESLVMQVTMEDHGLELVAIYHSHPRGPDCPSLDDVAQALYPECVHLICSLADPHQPKLRGFRITDGEAREVRLAFQSNLGTRAFSFSPPEVPGTSGRPFAAPGNRLRYDRLPSNERPKCPRPDRRSRGGLAPGQ